MSEEKVEQSTAGKEQKVGSLIRNALKREEAVMAKAANGQGELNPDK